VHLFIEHVVVQEQEVLEIGIITLFSGTEPNRNITGNSILKCKRVEARLVKNLFSDYAQCFFRY
ncbi:17488_t:CDS:1, partial [Entrophospora sp. SA101]